MRASNREENRQLETDGIKGRSYKETHKKKEIQIAIATYPLGKYFKSGISLKHSEERSWESIIEAALLKCLFKHWEPGVTLYSPPGTQ